MTCIELVALICCVFDFLMDKNWNKLIHLKMVLLRNSTSKNKFYFFLKNGSSQLYNAVVPVVKHSLLVCRWSQMLRVSGSRGSFVSWEISPEGKMISSCYNRWLYCREIFLHFTKGPIHSYSTTVCTPQGRPFISWYRAESNLRCLAKKNDHIGCDLAPRRWKHWLKQHCSNCFTGFIVGFFQWLCQTSVDE